MCIYTITLVLLVIFYLPNIFSLETWIIPILNIFITLLFLLIILKIYSTLVVHKYLERYMEINDQEYGLLTQLKEKKPELYYNAIHTAYLSERIARNFSLDFNLATAGGYYHRIIGLYNGEALEHIELISIKQNFLPK